MIVERGYVSQFSVGAEPALGDWHEVDDDAVLPEQYHGGPNLTTPERRMWAACMEDAINLALKGGEKERVWFSDQRSSFTWVCNALDLDASAVRTAILAQCARVDAGLDPRRRYLHQGGTRTKIMGRP